MPWGIAAAAAAAAGEKKKVEDVVYIYLAWGRYRRDVRWAGCI
jgi:hypothetical protein